MKNRNIKITQQPTTLPSLALTHLSESPVEKIPDSEIKILPPAGRRADLTASNASPPDNNHTSVQSFNGLSSHLTLDRCSSADCKALARVFRNVALRIGRDWGLPIEEMARDCGLSVSHTYYLLRQ